MKLATRYNRVNLITSLIVLLITGIVYYAVIHFILTEKLDRDLAVEENEIEQYAKTFQKLPLPGSYLDQKVYFRELAANTPYGREFTYTTYYNTKERETEPGRSLITVLYLSGKAYEVTITKSRVESEDLVRIILLITSGVTGLLLLSLLLINRFVLSQLWKPFYTILEQIKNFNLTKMDEIPYQASEIDEFNELNSSASAMAQRVNQDYRELKSFTDNASHEMMTPLAVINSKLDNLLQNGPFTDKQGILLEDIYLAIGRLSRLNQSLLLLTKIENKLITDIQEIDLKEVLDEKSRQFEELLLKDGLKLHINLKSAKISMSRYLADILINNLLSNAIRHNYKGGQIWLNLHSDSLQIINTGKSSAIEGRAFERFFKSTSSEGMGLGLSITKQICSLYNFQIEYSFTDGNHHFLISFSS